MPGLYILIAVIGVGLGILLSFWVISFYEKYEAKKARQARIAWLKDKENQ